MKITRKNLAKSIVELTVTQEKSNIDKYRKEAIEYLQKNAEVKGFRKWAKIPEDVIVRQFWEDYIKRISLDKAIEKLYVEALKKEKINPVAQWEIKEIVSEDPLTIVLNIEVLPTPEVSDKYKKISLTKTKIDVTKEEVENAISDIERRFTQFVEDEKGKVELWDRVTISTSWYDKEWKLLDNTTMEHYPLIIWTNILVPGFEEQLIGAKKDDKLDLNITFPKDYHNKDFASKETIFKTTIEKIEKAKKPEFTEEFIEQLRGKKLDLKWFKELIKEEIKETKEANARIDEEQKLIDELIKISKLEIWDALLADQTEKMFHQISNNMAQEWVQMQQYLESLKLSKEQYKENHIKEIALKRISWDLILHEIMKLEKIEVSDEEVKKELEKIKTKFQNEEVLKRLEEMYKEWTEHYNELKERMKMRKLIDSFFKEEKISAKK